MSLSRVANIGLDGTTVTITIGKTTVPATSAKYGDALSPSKLAYMGAQDTAEITPGTYEADDAEIEFSAIVWRTVVMPALAANGYGNKPLSIVVSRSHPDAGDDSDLLEGCRLTKSAASTTNSSDAEKTTATFTVRQVRWTDARRTLNQLTGVAQGDNTI